MTQKNNHPLPLLERKEGSWTVLALIVLQVKWLCSCYSPPNLGGVGGGYRKAVYNSKLC